MKREKIIVKFQDGRSDIIMVSDSISIYDTTEGTTIIKSQGYVDRVIPSDNIKSISLEHLQDKTQQTDETLEKTYEILRSLENLYDCLTVMADKCLDLMDDITEVSNKLEEV